MADGVTILNNSPEEVAFKLMSKIIGSGRNEDKAEVLRTYYECLMVVKGNNPDEAKKK